jgi:hypothetical protein
MHKTRHLLSLAAAALACALVIAGCGSSSSKSSTSTAAPAATQSSTSTGTGSSTSTGSASSSSEIAAAVSECKQLISSESKLPSGAKKKLEGACAAAAKGDTSAIKRAAREVCEEVINTASLPASSKEQALASCQS